MEDEQDLEVEYPQAGDSDESGDYVENALDLEFKTLNPVSGDIWVHINRDMMLGNLDPVEMAEIKLNEKIIGLLETLKKSGYNVNETLLTHYKRKSAVQLVVSNSKDGFLQNLRRTQAYKGFQRYEGLPAQPQQQQQGGGGLPRFFKNFKR